MTSLLDLLFLIPAAPLAGSLLLALSGRRMPRAAVAFAGCGSVGLSALLTVVLAVRFLLLPPPGHVFTQPIVNWISVGNLTITASFTLDALSIVMALVITVVGFLIHVYSAEYLRDDPDVSRFFASLNLFVGAMLVLVLADNLLLLYAGWEGVGLCSYLLIGFWYRDPANGRAARKAFITTRVGDTALAVGVVLLFTTFGTLDIRDLSALAASQLQAGSPLAVAAAALLLGGAVGKSAQLPLQVWLPDAMAGPTPVSALIHAATMVTAGVYLIARMHAFFLLAPVVLTAVAAIGAVTLLAAGCSALVQRDLKRVLAYSTISQIGYMFLALGVGAWSAALFHFMTHAFFKSLLFLGAGVVINAQHHERDLHRMGGLRQALPLTFWTFLVGSASLSALPFVTAGFYSKDLILWDVWASPSGGLWLWLAGLVGALLTTLYTARMLFLVFFGEIRTPVGARPGRRIELPLVILAVLCSVAGFVELPSLFGEFRPFSEFLETALPPLELAPEGGTALPLLLVTETLQVAGILLAYRLYLRRPRPRGEPRQAPVAASLRALWLSGWGFDWLYDRLFVAPLSWFARVNRRDAIDTLYAGLAGGLEALSLHASRTQTGRIRWYASGIAVGAIIVLGIVVLS